MHYTTLQFKMWYFDS